MKSAFHILVSGFTQSRQTLHGVLKLREELIQDGHSNSLKSRVWYLPWTVDVKRVASDLSNVCSYHGIKPVINISSYSYGGHTSIRLANELDRRGIEVLNLNLCDPVHRTWLLPKPLPTASSMLGRKYSFRLKIPPNVRYVQEFFQLENRPQGHRLKLCNGTKITQSTQIYKTHQRMDDSKEFHDCVRKLANKTNEMLD